MGDDRNGPRPIRPLDAYRGYLRLLVRLQVHPDSRLKVDESDVVQQTFLVAHQKRDQFRGTTDAEYLAWLRTILARQLADALRKLQGRGVRDPQRQAFERSLDVALEESSARLGHLLVQDQTSPSERLIRS